MEESFLLGLTQNIAILLAFSMLYDYIRSHRETRMNIYMKTGTGIVLGGIGIVLILTPWQFIPGIFFDTRSVMLSISGLFFGPIPTIIAMLIAGSYRIYMGGAGVFMGIAVVFTSGVTGLIWRYFMPDWRKKNHFITLLVLGVTVHIIMLCCTIFLPSEIRLETLKNIIIPVIFIYPGATVSLGLLMLNQDVNWENRKALNLSEERWHYALEGADDGVWDWNPVTNEVYYSKQYKLMLGYDEDEMGNTLNVWAEKLFPDDRQKVYSLLNKHIAGETSIYFSEHRLLCKDGTYKWILDRGKIMVRDAQGKPLRMIGTHTDITEQKEAQEKIKKLNEELEQKVIERTNELVTKNTDLEKMNKYFVGRELRMIELKEKNKVLVEQLKNQQHE